MANDFAVCRPGWHITRPGFVRKANTRLRFICTPTTFAFLFSLAAKFDAATKAERIVVLQIHGELVRDDDSSRFVKTPCADGAGTYSP